MIPSLYVAFFASLGRELTAVVRSGSDVYNPLIFFLSVIVFVPLGISPDDAVLASIAPGMVWIIALLSVLLSLDKVFQTDFEDGCLEQMMLSGQSMYWIVITKGLAHWLATGLPLTLLSPLLAMMLALPSEGYVALLASLFFGTGSLCFIGAIGAALTVSVRRGGLLLSLIIIPLYSPVLIFGANCVHSAVIGESFMAPLAILAAIFILSLSIAPIACAGALRINLGH